MRKFLAVSLAIFMIALTAFAVRASGFLSNDILTPAISFRLANDSLVMSWNNVQTPEQPIARYDWEIHKVAGDTLIIAGSTTQTSTVFLLSAPLLGDSLVIYGRVRAANTRGKIGPWGRSSNYVMRTQDPGPAAPTPIIRDTTLMLTYNGVDTDSLWVAPNTSKLMCAYFVIGHFQIELADPVNQPTCPPTQGGQLLHLWQPFPWMKPTARRA